MVLQLSEVACEKLSGLSLTVGPSELRVVQLSSKEEKASLIELAVGERTPEAGTIRLNGVQLEHSKPGSIGWIPANGGLISNLKTWENVTLPLWYHGKHRRATAETRIKRWLAVLAVPEDEWENFMASPAGKLKPLERRMAGLLRGLVLQPALLVVDAALFDDLPQATCNAWMSALELCVREAQGCALVVAENESALPWEKIRWKHESVG